MAQTNLIGRKILGYTVQELLGSGAFGTVYKATKSNAAGQYVRALKHITIPSAKQYNSILNSMGGDVAKADNYFLQMLKNIVTEISVLNDLSAKGGQYIVRYYENEIEESQNPLRYDIYILMEYLTPLEDYKARKNFTVRDVIQLGLDVLRGLESCHDNNVIHRDIKEDNIFVSENGDYKIGDFGVSKVLKNSSRAESMKGTPNYLAPEVYLGKESYTKSVDLYSLGIVLYRLLNYDRNPFLPKFPQAYTEENENMAFEQRMRGEKPDLPALGGEEIASVIIKSISGQEERFQSAEDFYIALLEAREKTASDVLDALINARSSALHVTDGFEKASNYNPTLGETMKMDENIASNKTRNDTLSKDLFDTQREEDVEVAPVPQTSVGGSFKAPILDRMDEPVVMDKDVVNKFLFAGPIVILIIGLILYFAIVPVIYGKTVSLFDCLFAGPEAIVQALHQPNVVLPQVHSVIGLIVVWWCWLGAFTASLFLVGKQIQGQTEPQAYDALLKNKEPYLVAAGISDAVKFAKANNGNVQVANLLTAVKRLEERLESESDFGYGNRAIINCENNIAAQLQFLESCASELSNGNPAGIITEMNKALMNINMLLRQRMELKKKC